ESCIITAEGHWQEAASSPLTTGWAIRSRAGGAQPSASASAAAGASCRRWVRWCSRGGGGSGLDTAQIQYGRVRGQLYRLPMTRMATEGAIGLQVSPLTVDFLER